MVTLELPLELAVAVFERLAVFYTMKVRVTNAKDAKLWMQGISGATTVYLMEEGFLVIMNKTTERINHNGNNTIMCYPKKYAAAVAQIAYQAATSVGVSSDLAFNLVYG